MNIRVPAGPCVCFSVLVEIRQNIFRLCGQSIGTGGGQGYVIEYRGEAIDRSDSEHAFSKRWAE